MDFRIAWSCTGGARWIRGLIRAASVSDRSLLSDVSPKKETGRSRSRLGPSHGCISALGVVDVFSDDKVSLQTIEGFGFEWRLRRRRARDGRAAGTPRADVHHAAGEAGPYRDRHRIRSLRRRFGGYNEHALHQPTRERGVGPFQ